MLKSRSWTPEEDAKLIQLMQTFSSNKWCMVAQSLGTRSPVQCMNRWTKILKPGLLKGYWSKEEDEQLLEWIKVNGPKKWSECAKFMKKRSAKQCRERWLNHLDPKIIKEDWTEEEDKQIYELYKKYGTSWSKLAREIKGRTENAIKNRFYSSVRSLIANENGTDTQARKEKKRVNKNYGFFSVLKQNSDGDAKEGIEGIKKKMLSHTSVRDPLLKKKRSPDVFYENLYRKNFPEDHQKSSSDDPSKPALPQSGIDVPTAAPKPQTPEQNSKIEETKESLKAEKETQDEQLKTVTKKEQEKESSGLESDPLFKEFKQFRESLLMHQFEAFKAFMLGGGPFFNFP